MLNNEMFLLNKEEINFTDIEIENIAFILLPEKGVFFDGNIDFYNKIIQPNLNQFLT